MFSLVYLFYVSVQTRKSEVASSLTYMRYNFLQNLGIAGPGGAEGRRGTEIGRRSIGILDSNKVELF